jgi:hypothetical protein
MAFFRRMLAAGATMVLGYAMKKLMDKVEAQTNTMREKAEEQRDPKEFKQLKQDPKTGVYYAED